MARRVLKTRWFSRWARKSGISDAILLAAIHEIERGIVDARLGPHLYKKRVPISGRGKRGGARTLIAMSQEGGWLFLFGYLKSDRENVTDEEARSLQNTARRFAELEGPGLEQLLAAGEWEEVQSG